MAVVTSYVDVPLTPAPVRVERARAAKRCALILAGGRGARMQPVIKRWLGCDIPKQYCTFVGSRSMIRHTIDRATSLVKGRDCITIIAPEHRAHYQASVGDEFDGQLIEQPSDRGTAAGILLPMAAMMNADPAATVVILPSDHFVYPESRFLGILSSACELAERHIDRLILLGAEATRPETDYGWIRLGTPLEASGPLYGVSSFHEKPTVEAATELYEEGAVWNTFIMAAKVRTLWTLGWRYLPEFMVRLEVLRDVQRAVRANRAQSIHEAMATDKLYDLVQAADFSKDVLQRAMPRCAVIPMNGVEWCDWGRPERVHATLQSMGKVPHFADKARQA